MQVSQLVPSLTAGRAATRRTAARVAAGAAVAGTAVLALSAPAFAHVTVQPEGAAAKGSYAVVDVKVPNERDNASTTKVEVNLPADHPLASVMAEPVPGWSVQLTKTKLAKPLTVHGDKIDQAVTKVTWTADGKGIEPGYFRSSRSPSAPFPTTPTNWCSRRSRRTPTARSCAGSRCRRRARTSRRTRPRCSTDRRGRRARRGGRPGRVRRQEAEHGRRRGLRQQQ